MNEEYSVDCTHIRQNTQPKDKIVLCNSYSYGVDHMKGWVKRGDNGLYTMTAYSVGQDGEVYEHFKPNKTHRYINDDVDQSIIGITLVNIGYLNLNPYNGSFTNWLNDVHDGENMVFKEWRGYKYWEGYTEEQEKSTFELTTYLLSEYNIKKHIIEHNTKMDDAAYVEGVLYRSNFNKNYLDPSPAWDYEGFKKRFQYRTENEQTTNQ
jgi:hypothetical protein